MYNRGSKKAKNWHNWKTSSDSNWQNREGTNQTQELKEDITINPATLIHS